LDNYFCPFIYHRKAQMYQNLNIRLIRKDSSEENDDRILIRPSLTLSTDSNTTSMVYNVIHTIPKEYVSNETTCRSSMSFESTASLITYIRTLLNLLQYDNSPFSNIQFDLPMMPSILVSPENLNVVRYSIYEYLEVLMKSWPTTRPATPSVPARARSNSYARHLFFDDDDQFDYCKNRGYTCHS